MDNDNHDRRKYQRMKLSVPVVLEPTETEGSPIRCATTDLSEGGCYIETIFPLPVGTHLDLQLSIGNTVLIAATVVTSDPQVGNGIGFMRMLPEDREALEAFLKAAQQAEDSGSVPTAESSYV